MFLALVLGGREKNPVKILTGCPGRVEILIRGKTKVDILIRGNKKLKY